MQQANNRLINLNTDEDEIDLQEIFNTLLRYKKSIVAITLMTLIISIFYAYFSPNIYQAKSMLKLSPQDMYGTRGDFMSIAMGKESSNILDELVIVKTRHMATKALKDLKLGTRYFATKYFKTYELYKNSPFIVTTEAMDTRAQGMLFELIPIDNKRFQLRIPSSWWDDLIAMFSSPLAEDERPLVYDKIHQYGEKITTPWFSFTVQKLYDLDNLTYAFSVNKNAHMSSMITGGISASFNEQFGNIIILAFTDNVPLRAKEILDALGNTYIQENLDIQAEGASKKLHFIDMQIDAINQTLEGSSEKLQKYKATNVIVSLDNKAQLTSGKLSNLESTLYEINMQTDMMENIIQYMDTHEDIQGINIDSVQHANSTINRIILEIQRVLKKRATISVYHTQSHPLIITSNKELASLKTSLHESILGTLRTLTKQKVSIQALIDEHKKKLQKLPEQEQKLEQLTRNFLFNEKIYSFLLNKRAETAIIEASTVSKIRIIEAAETPLIPIKPRKSLIILVGLILGLILGISLAFFRSFLDNTIKTLDDIERLTDIPVYGVIPSLDIKNTEHYQEAMNVLWSNIEFSQIESNSKLITITSSVPTEGKTLTISQLGSLISKNNKSVIILDLDMRKATLHEQYKLHNLKGMSTLLTQKCTLKEAIQQTDYPNLQVITSGPKPPNPTGLIMSDLLEKVLEKLKEHYDYVLLDSPPIGLVADAMKIMHLADVTFIVMRAEFSKKDFIKNITRITQDENINPGIILNDIDLTKSYGYGYGYGYGHEKL